MHVIYKITNKINNKIYIGQSINYEKRIKEHIYARKNEKKHLNQIIDIAIKKYGKENFSFEIIDKSESNEETDFLERKYIKEYDCLVPKGYNLLKGGRKQQGSWNMKEIEIYDLNGNYIESCESASEYARINKKYFDASIRDCCNGIVKRHYDKIFKWKNNDEKIIPYIKPQSSRKKIVYQYDLQGNYVNEYESVTLASEKTNTRRIGIINCANGKQKTANNFQWTYIKKDKIEIRNDILNNSKLNKIYKIDDNGNILKVYETTIQAVLDMGFERKKYKVLWKYLNKNKKFNGYYWKIEKKKPCQA